VLHQVKFDEVKKITHHATNYKKTVHPRRSQSCALPVLDLASRRLLASRTPTPLPRLAMAVSSGPLAHEFAGRRKKSMIFLYFLLCT
jgi:hypothetical protein